MYKNTKARKTHQRLVLSKDTEDEDVNYSAANYGKLAAAKGLCYAVGLVQGAASSRTIDLLPVAAGAVFPMALGSDFAADAAPEGASAQDQAYMTKRKLLADNFGSRKRCGRVSIRHQFVINSSYPSITRHTHPSIVIILFINVHQFSSIFINLHQSSSIVINIHPGSASSTRTSPTWSICRSLYTTHARACVLHVCCDLRSLPELRQLRCFVLFLFC